MTRGGTGVQSAGKPLVSFIYPRRKRRKVESIRSIPTTSRPGPLKHELQRKLHLARSLRRENIVECRRTDVGVGQSKVRAVQDVKQLGAELELLRFRHFEVLKCSEVPVGISRADI